MPELDIPNGFTPREYQARFMRYFDKGGKRAVWVVHRRGGKDLTALHQTCKSMHQRRGVYWHVFPTAEQGRKAIWEGFTKDGQRILEQVFPKAIRKTPSDWFPNAEMVVELKCGSIWRLLGSDKMEVVGAGPVGVVFSEFALAKPRTWDLVRPMLRENDGWAAFISTPRGANHFKRLFDVAKADARWFHDVQTLYDTRAYDPEATIAEERASGMEEALIRQEYLCDWTAANVGSVYGEAIAQLEARGAAAPFSDSSGDVFTAWDLGFSDATGVWFYRADGKRLDVIDHYEAHGQPLSHYFDVLDARGYAYATHWLPHDARARTLVTGSSILEQFIARFGASHVRIGPGLSLLDGIQASRWLLQQPWLRIHGEKCADGLEALRAYRYEYDEDRKTYTRKPVHDWSSHTADAWRYLACVVRASQALGKPVPAVAPQPIAKPLAEAYTLDALWEDNEASRKKGRI